MKMEVLSVQNQFQGQFSVIGPSKVKDWASPLTPPLPSARSRQIIRNSEITTQNSSDGLHDKEQVKHFYHKYHHANYRLHKQPKHLDEETMDVAAAASIDGTTTSSHFAYNNNLLCCEIQSPQTSATQSVTCFSVSNDDIDGTAITELSQRIQAELRAAKSRHLACTEVSLPWDLTPRIASEIIKASEREPCGVRGCTIFIEFENEPNNIRRIASLKIDPNTVSTFELYLTLKQDKSGWTSLLPQFLKNLTRSSTVLISPDFTMTKNKLYSCE